MKRTYTDVAYANLKTGKIGDEEYYVHQEVEDDLELAAGAAMAMDTIERMSRIAHKKGLPFPSEIDFAYSKDKGLNGGLEHFPNRKSRKIEGRYLLSLTAPISNEEPWFRDYIIAHELGHAIDYKKRELGLSGETARGSEADERRAIRHSLELLDDPWDELRSRIKLRKAQLEEISGYGERSDVNQVAYKKRMSSWARRVVTGPNRVETIVENKSKHLNLLSVVNEVENYCQKNGLPMNQELISEARRIDNRGRDYLGL